MISQKNTRIFDTEQYEVLPGTVITEEGTPLVLEKVNGKTYVKPCTGAAGEVFVGFSKSRNAPPTVVSKVREFVIPEDGIVDLGRLPISGQILVKGAGTVLDVVTSADPVDNTEVRLSGQILKFYVSNDANSMAGRKGYYQMHFLPTIQEARAIVGDEPIGGLPSSVQGVIGVIVRGTIGTSMYDASKDWGAASAVQPYLGANGRLSTQGNVKLDRVIIESAPTTEADQFGVISVRF